MAKLHSGISKCMRSLVSVKHISVRHSSAGTFFPDLPLNYIGERVDCQDAKESFDVEEPATGKRLCKMLCSGRKDVDIAVQSAKQVQQEWAELTGFERMKLLRNASKLIKERLEELAKIEVHDTGKPIWEARNDVQTAIDILDYYAGLAPTLCGEHYKLSSGSFGYTIREPLGVVAAIGAWNFPIQIATWKAAPALACGNAVVFKPSPLTPLNAVMLADIFVKSGLPKGLFNVVQGAADTGTLLTSHPDVAKVSFTGSVPVGFKVMESCTKSIKHVTLELGGKSPLIMFDDCDKENAVNGALAANFFSQGQVCSNATRVFIQEKIYQEVVSKLVERVEKIKPGDPHEESTKTGAIINGRQADRILNFIRRAKEQRGNVLCGGKLVRLSSPVLKGKYITPCVIEAADHMEISKEEVFGPVMNVYSFKTEDEVVERANNTQFGLAANIFTRDLNRAHRVVSKLNAGSCYINNFCVFPVELPFGGFKNSGIGKECGKQTLEHFTRVKAVYVEAGDVQSPF